MPVPVQGVKRTPEEWEDYHEWRGIKSSILFVVFILAALVGYLTNNAYIGVGILFVGVLATYPLSQRIHERRKENRRLAP